MSDPEFTWSLHCVKSVRIRSYSGPHFPVFGKNTERYSVSLCIQFECRKMRCRITPNTDNFYASGYITHRVTLTKSVGGATKDTNMHSYFISWEKLF